jgi:hypothetical protein
MVKCESLEMTGGVAEINPASSITAEMKHSL